MKKTEIIAYEMIGDKKALRVLRLKPSCIEVRRGGWFSRKLEYTLDTKASKYQMKKSGYYGRKELAPFCNGYYPHVIRIIDKTAGVHIFRVDRDLDAEVFDNYIRREKGITAFG